MSLINFLFKEKDVRKIFGKKEIEIIRKQLQGIKLTQSEKNRLSRDIRPKLKIIEKLSQYSEDFELKKNLANLKIIKETVNLILQDKIKDSIIAILLFGSHVIGDKTFRSDIDICVVFKKIKFKEATKFRIRISGFSDKVDVQVFNMLPQKIKRSIARNHRILYKTKEFDNVLFSIRYLKDQDYFIRERLLDEKN